MNERNRRSLAQNFLAKRHLAVTIIEESSISRGDIVYEIGPGNGILTKELIKRARRVIAVEKDQLLYLKLKKKFAYADNIDLYNADFLRFEVKDNCYKVFANIPFNITSAIIRKIVHAANPPDEAYLIIQREAAEKSIGMPRTTQFSVLIKPWFRPQITKCFSRTDFSPMPKVDAVLLHIAKRTPPLVSPANTAIYGKFIRRGFGGWRKNLKANYSGVFTYKQWKRLSHDLRFPIDAKPSELRFRQWLGLFEFYRKCLFRQ